MNLFMILCYSFKRPIGIGIYGHPSHEISYYTLEISLHEESKAYSDHFSDFQQYDEHIEESDESSGVK